MAGNVSYISTYDACLTDTQLRASDIGVKNVQSDQFLIEMLAVLRKMEYHLMIATDANLDNEEV